ncbi:hypothetical protein O6H91_17G025300 [Diphasiastrum complanatum]|nr:hypothetical protein O6H91_17G025300 [Diphasiastrum complanatum]
MESRDEETANEGPGDSTSAGWPLGLEPLGFKMRVLETLRFSEANDFKYCKTPSFAAESSSDLDSSTQSASSISFREKPITLGEILGLSTNFSTRFAVDSFGSLEFPVKVRNVKNGKGWWSLISCADEKANKKTAKSWWDSINCACAKACNQSSRSEGNINSPPDEVVQVKSKEEEEIYINLVFEDTVWSSNENPQYFSEEDP